MPYGDPVELSNGETEYTFEKLPLDGRPVQDTYSVQEVTVGGADVVGNKVSVPASAVGADEGTYDYAVQVSAVDNGYLITNTSKSSILTITNVIEDKTIDSAEGLDQSFTFKVGEREVSLKNNESKKIAFSSDTTITETVPARTWTVYVDGKKDSGNPSLENPFAGNIKANIKVKVSGGSDQTVEFKHVRNGKEFNVHKMWFVPTVMLDTVELPDSLSFDVYRTTHKPNTSDPGPEPGEENTELVLPNQSIGGWDLLSADNFWTNYHKQIPIPNLPKAKISGDELYYGVVEDLTGNWVETHDGFSQWVSGDTAELHNYFSNTKITGTKTWIDDAKEHDNNALNLVLKQSSDGGTTWTDLSNKPSWTGTPLRSAMCLFITVCLRTIFISTRLKKPPFLKATSPMRGR